MCVGSGNTPRKVFAASRTNTPGDLEKLTMPQGIDETRLREIRALLADANEDVSGVQEVWDAARILLAAYDAATGWQDISGADKTKRYDIWSRYKGRYVDCWYSNGGWRYYDGEGGVARLVDDVTHCRPLPSPPDKERTP